MENTDNKLKICPMCDGHGEVRYYTGKDVDCRICNKTGVVNDEQYINYLRKTSNPNMQARFHRIMGEYYE